MPRVSGDKNLSLREQRLKAEVAAAKAKERAAKAQLKVVELRKKEIAERLG
ncbi:MAG TPA: hypothetical protein VED40_23365 [Azospirillaceae bacterium]|nr:hypothetical protein [Azospirillaceae bacterium]